MQISKLAIRCMLVDREDSEEKILKCRGVLFVVVAFSKHFEQVSFLVIQNVFTESVFR